MSDSALLELYSSLDARWRPEAVAEQIMKVFDGRSPWTSPIRAVAAQARSWSRMPDDFRRPDGMAKQIGTASELFSASLPDSATDIESILAFLGTAGQEIFWDVQHTDFKFNRLSRDERREVGMDISRRQYNKRFRLLGRMVSRLTRLQKEQLKRSLVLASNSRLASEITEEMFLADVNSACFIAYYASRCSLRSVFTNAKQVRPFDEVCDALMKRCEGSPTTNWFAIAFVHPVPSVLSHLTDEQRGRLLGRFFSILNACAGLLREVWEAGGIDAEKMTVARGNDSSTWNIAAGAWNKIRSGWLALLHDMRMDSLLDEMCPGKVMRLMAADVAYWHRSSGDDVHPDTKVWASLPRPWDVLSGTVHCGRKEVIEACVAAGVDPKKAGWVEFSPPKKIEPFTPTPELVHGISVGDPDLAASLRKLGVFSGKGLKGDVWDFVEVVEDVSVARADHAAEQEARRAEQEAGA